MRRDLHAFWTARQGLLAWVLGVTLLAGCSTAPVTPPAPPPTPEPPPRVLKAPKVALALGGGAARGFAHIGVIQVLEEAGIRPDLVVGTSAGSLVAALYASGKSGAELARLAETMDEGAITDWSFPLKGLIKGEALARYVRAQTGGRNLEQLPMPLGIVATQLADGQGVMFRTGDTGLAVRASSAVPAVFQPVEINGKAFVDGGLVAPVPVRFARQMGAEVVIAIDISSPPNPQLKTDPFSMLMQTVAIMGRSINALELREAEVVLRPELNGVASSDFTARKQAIAAGRAAALAGLERLRKAVAPR
ncbi:patatin-like phospholipase family protein [Inhella gelatinilytica]|uniref:Patatin-like phospholipase family protein n=1 Tax=Inhella gelatinilytica TaxID=2795030 RepID=A0A931NEZ2_9BURK|nr:patatin-like phospholipase family protein [Inhella gelatinilytica]MBH9554209.1 patatin-like phospholipase family protein [Inhella gelatinilytica]